jgi:hypothetical protein
LQDPPKFTKIGIFGLKINHLATLFPSRTKVSGKRNVRFSGVESITAILYVACCTNV